MANCTSCVHHEVNSGQVSCTLHDAVVSENSWCGCHEPVAPKVTQRITDNPRSAEDIHD